MSVQPRYSLLFREIERELLPLAGEEGLGVIPYNPLAGGLLTGKYKPGAKPEDNTRFTLGTAGAMYQDRYWNERSFATVAQLHELADEAGVPLATLAVAWVMANPLITAPLLGASRPEQLDATLAAAEYKLDAGLKQRLDELTAEYRKGDAAKIGSPPGLPTSCGRPPPAGGNTSGPAKPVPRCFPIRLRRGSRLSWPDGARSAGRAPRRPSAASGGTASAAARSRRPRARRTAPWPSGCRSPGSSWSRRTRS